MEVVGVCSKIGNLVKFFPTGTVFVFNFLNPLLTDYGNCSNTVLGKYLTIGLIALCGFFCCFSCFTDSYKGCDGKTHYGVATLKGMWPSPYSDSESESVDLSTYSYSYRLRFGDFVHAFFALVVFGVLVLLQPNTVSCLYPSLQTDDSLFLVLIPLLTFVGCWAFMFFPNHRQGIGYPYPSAQQASIKTDLLLPQTS